MSASSRPTIARAVAATRPFSAACTVLEKPDGRVLVVWNKKLSGWAFPGGKIEPGEEPFEAALRELREETGLIVREVRSLFDSAPPECERARGVPMAERVHVFHAEAFEYATPIECEPGCPVTWLHRSELLAATPFAEFYRDVFAVLDGDEA